MDILLTGATGLIGHSLARLLSLEHHATAITYGPLSADFPSGINSIEQDLTSKLDYILLPRKIDAVIHLAQSLHFREFPDAVEDIFAVNTHSTLRLAEYARKAGADCFILASTGGIYAPSRNRLTETDAISPPSFYASTKYAAELLISNYSRLMRIIILRFFFVYGPRQRNMLIPNLVDKVKKGLPVTVDGNPGLSINPIFVEDAVRVFEPLLSRPFNGAFNVAGDEVVTMTELIQKIAVACKREPIIQYREPHQFSYLVGDNSRMKYELGVLPSVHLSDGLGLMVRASGEAG
jgi:nucleoside-diphosphate-sugar epimerase